MSRARPRGPGPVDRLFGRLRAALRPGGRLVAQCGGEGNVASVVAAIRDVDRSAPFAGFQAPPPGTWHFASPGETVDALGPHLERLPEHLHVPFVDAVVQRLGRPAVFDYVGLNIEARRPACWRDLSPRALRLRATALLRRKCAVRGAHVACANLQGARGRGGGTAPSGGQGRAG